MATVEEQKHEEEEPSIEANLEHHLQDISTNGSSKLQSNRPSHLESLIKSANFDQSFINSLNDSIDDDGNIINSPASHLLSIMEEGVTASDDNNEMPPPTPQEIHAIKFFKMKKRLSVYQISVPERLVEVRIKDYSYYVPIKSDAPTIKTVGNQSICYGIYEFFRRIHRYRMYRNEIRHSKTNNDNISSTENNQQSSFIKKKPVIRASTILNPYDKKPVLSNINLILKPGHTYLILGPPECGKTSLLQAIAGRLPGKSGMVDETAVTTTTTTKPRKDRSHYTGRIEYNGVTVQDDPTLVLPNVVSFVGQLDIHAPYLTVQETFDFAFQSRTGGKHYNLGIDSIDIASNLDKENFTENLTIDGLDLTTCANTFVGNSDIRGVSGGQRRRVTVGEMMQDQNPVACADEISTGLDAAVTHDIVQSIVSFAKAAQTTRIVSLLQPGPETFCLFDEVILLAKGHVVYAGPINEVVDYFESLGYKQLPTIDVADFLQLIPTPDGASLFDASNSPVNEHYTAEGFAQAFRESEQYKKIQTELDEPRLYDWTKPRPDSTSNNTCTNKSTNGVPKSFKVTYKNSFLRTTKLNLIRHFTLWKRDKAFIIGKLFENIGMAVATGGILFGCGRTTWNLDNISQQEADNLDKLSAGIYGALFMTTFHILLGTMTSAPDEIDERQIHYKHCDANFYQTFAFVFGRFVSTIPQRTIEIFAFGIPLYWMIGLDASPTSFFLYITLLICYTTGVKMMFSILAQCLPKKANVQGIGTFVVLLLTLFGGFIVNPKSIPEYYTWIYWANPMAWALQGLASIEFMSTKYDGKGINFLRSRGFKTGREWIAYSFAYMIPFTLFCTFILGFVLKYVRIEPEKQTNKKKPKVSMGQIGDKTVMDADKFNLPFTPVDLTFKNLTYEVDASTTGEKLRLLNEVSGAFKSGRMCALMGSSGAGKTTLMDVIAMRKTSGTITGEIQLNGHPQERVSFLRSSGYVEQFDVQQAELTVRETVIFCARLRLDVNNPAIGDDDGKLRYVDHVLETMELTDIQTLQVGSFEEGGLTFEQRKRLAIACELAGSPSVIFLDEPTSGLDSRGALVVIRAMKRIAESGRTVCATIHQPSSAVFEMFDDLILLKKGGNVVFFGELGVGSCNLIEYFESYGADKIEYGENPAAWMLHAYAGEGANTNRIDYSELYKTSKQYTQLLEQIQNIEDSRTDNKRIHYETAFPTTANDRLQYTNRRIATIYKRSPAYNLTRLVIAVFYSFLIGSVFLRNKKGVERQLDESSVDGILGTIFLSTIIIGVTSISMAVPVMKKIRDVFYKHRASGMIEHNSLSIALTLGEIPYIFMVSLLFGVVYYFTVGLFNELRQFWDFYLFFTLNVAIYAFFGQAFICLVPDVPTSGALVGALVGYNVFFSGYIVKPQHFTGPFKLGLWTAPGRFIYEGIVTTQFKGLTFPVVAETYSPFYFSLNCTNQTVTNIEPCIGTINQYTTFAFGGKFKEDSFWLDLSVLLGYLVLSRLLTWFALKRFNYVNT